MALLLYSIVRRHMKKTGRFTVFDNKEPVPGDVKLSPGESLIGWYRNPPPWENNWVIFTSNANVVVDDGKVDRVALSDMVSYETPKSKLEATGVRVWTRDSVHFIRVAGRGEGSIRHTYSLVAVLHAMIPIRKDH